MTQRTPPRIESRETATMIDMSETINIPNTHVPNLGLSGSVTERPPTGTIPKRRDGRGVDYSVPPPPIRGLERGAAVDQNPRAYAGLIRELITETNREYQTELENKLDKRIQESILEGFSTILGEIKKLKLDGKANEPVESIINEDRNGRRDRIEIFPENDNLESRPNIQRGLNYRESVHSSSESVLAQRQQGKIAISVDKWDISFDGNIDKLYIDDFIFRIEYMLKYHSYTWLDLQGEFHKLLKGDAKDWYWLLVQYRTVETWDEMKNALKIQYGSNRSGYEFMRDFEERRQRAGESIDNYFQAMRKLRLRLRNPLPEYEVIRIIKRNLRQNISQIVYPVQVFSVEHLRDACKEIEKNYFEKENTSLTSQPRFRPARKFVEDVSQVIPVEEDGIELVEEIQSKSNRSHTDQIQLNANKMLCWNCRLPGHAFTDCTSMQRNIFCYKCGQMGVVTPTCPKCSGNRVRSVSKAAESRSTQTNAN